MGRTWKEGGKSKTKKNFQREKSKDDFDTYKEDKFTSKKNKYQLKNQDFND